MKISEIIKGLQDIKEVEGDIEVYISANHWDPTTHYIKTIEPNDISISPILIKDEAGNKWPYDHMWKKYVDPESRKGSLGVIIKLKKLIKNGKGKKT